MQATHLDLDPRPIHRVKWFQKRQIPTTVCTSLICLKLIFMSKSFSNPRSHPTNPESRWVYYSFASAAFFLTKKRLVSPIGKCQKKVVWHIKCATV